MGSIDAQNVAKEVLETLGKDKKVVLGKIIKKNGYKQNTADNPMNVTNTKSYQGVIQPVIKRWEEIRLKLTRELERKDLTKESMRDITDTLDKIYKNIQLLSGGATENINIKPLATLDELRQDDSNKEDSQS